MVDDDPDSLRALSYLLAADGYRVALASGGREALRRINSESPTASSLTTPCQR